MLDDKELEQKTKETTRKIFGTLRNLEEIVQNGGEYKLTPDELLIVLATHHDIHRRIFRQVLREDMSKEITEEWMEKIEQTADDIASRIVIQKIS